jgi:hypothetical protein
MNYPIKQVSGVLSKAVKQPARSADHSRLSSVEAKNA